MNKSKIEWCDYTWNPVTGCLHGCPYCYGKRIANRFGRRSGFNRVIGKVTKNGLKILDTKTYCQRGGKWEYDPYPFGYEPTFHRYRLDEPIKLKKSSKIFVVSMGDLFGNWVPDEWIEEVLKACRKAPQHTYIFLTKNPWGYGRLQAYYSKKDWLGVTIDGTGTGDNNFYDYKLKIKAMDYVAPVANRFVSIEPLIKPIDTKIIEGMDWIIIGAQTGPGAVKPKKEWVETIIDQCRKEKVPVFLKDNLNWPENIQEWPQVVK